LCEQLQVFLPEPPRPLQQETVRAAVAITPGQLGDVRRQIRDLAERRLLVPLSDAELACYERLCAIEDEGLRRAALHC
jgi:hypothetical protein